MLSGFGQLSAAFFGEILSRKHRQAVRVRSVEVADYLDRADLKKVDLESTLGPVQMIVKVLPQARRREALVWRFLAQAGTLPVPDLYHVEFDQRLGSYGVVLEFVAPLAETASWPPAQCGRVGRALASLHAPFWSKAGELPEPFGAPATAPEATVEPAARRFVDRMSGRRQAMLYAALPEAFTFLAKLLRMTPSFFAEAADLPATLIHGALDRSEVLFRPGGSPEPVLIDWQQARSGRGTEDVASLTNSLPAAARPAGSAELLAAYAEGIRSAGIDVSPERLAEEVARQRVLLGAKGLVAGCGQYAERSGQAEHRQWCASFVGEATGDVAEWKALLDALARKADHAHPPEPREIV